MRKNLFLFFLIFCTSSLIYGQGKFVDSLKQWIRDNPAIDSQYIQTLHRISYRLSEKDAIGSYYYYEQVSKLSDSLNFIYGKSLAQINLGILHYNYGNLKASNNAFFKAIDYAESCNAPRLKAVALNNIGDNFKTLKDYNKCRQYTNQAIVINKQLSAWRGVAINYELLQQCDFEEKLYESAEANLKKGMPFALLANENYILSQYYLGFAKMNSIENHQDSAIFFFNKAMTQAVVQNDLRNELQVYLAQAEYLSKLSPDDKLTMLDSALGIARRTRYNEGIAKAAEQLSLVYEEKKNKDSSLYFYHIYRTASDSLFSENNRRSVLNSESEWLIRRKETENRHLLELSNLQKRQIVFKNALLISVFILLFLTIVIAIFINKSIQSKKKRAEFLFKQKIAESQIQSLRAQMNPHFIFNSLNSIENFMMQNEKRKASDYMHKFALLIRTILESSRNELTTVVQDLEALKLYIDLEQMRFHNKFCYKENIDPELMRGDYYVPSLLIQPYVENAIVHGIAHSDSSDLKLIVSASLEDDHIKYVIKDNGIGRKQAADYNTLNKLRHKSVGLSITEERIHLYNQERNASGYVRITDLFDDTNHSAGTIVEVKIKAT